MVRTQQLPLWMAMTQIGKTAQPSSAVLGWFGTPRDVLSDLLVMVVCISAFFL